MADEEKENPFAPDEEAKEHLENAQDLPIFTTDGMGTSLAEIDGGMIIIVLTMAIAGTERRYLNIGMGIEDTENTAKMLLKSVALAKEKEANGRIN